MEKRRGQVRERGSPELEHLPGKAADAPLFQRNDCREKPPIAEVRAKRLINEREARAAPLPEGTPRRQRDPRLEEEILLERRDRELFPRAQVRGDCRFVRGDLDREGSPRLDRER